MATYATTIRTFEQSGVFAAYDAAVRFAESLGMSVGRMQAHSPTGLMYGRFNIQKWRNLRPNERAELHGTLTGNFRDGPVTIHYIERALLGMEAANA